MSFARDQYGQLLMLLLCIFAGMIPASLHVRNNVILFFVIIKNLPIHLLSYDFTLEDCLILFPEETWDPDRVTNLNKAKAAWKNGKISLRDKLTRKGALGRARLSDSGCIIHNSAVVEDDDGTNTETIAGTSKPTPRGRARISEPAMLMGPFGKNVCVVRRFFLFTPAQKT